MAGNSGSLIVGDGETLHLDDGTYDNTGTITTQASGEDSDITVGDGGTVRLTGGGSIILGSSQANRISTNASGSILENVDNIITGGGQIFSGAGMSLTNGSAGVIDGTRGMIVHDLAIRNAGILQASAQGGLTLRNDTIDNAGGVIRGGIAPGAPGIVALVDTTVRGGSLSGQIYLDGANTFDGSTASGAVTITSDGTVNVFPSYLSQSLTIKGTIENEGYIASASRFSNPIVFVDTDATLQGSGTLFLFHSSIQASSAVATLTNKDHIITGNGGIAGVAQDGSAGLSLVNDGGTIVASNGSQFTIQNLKVTNEHGGTLQGSDDTDAIPGFLILDHVTVINDGAAISSGGPGGLVALYDGTRIQGGDIVTNANGSVLVAGGSTVTIEDGATSNVRVTAGSTLNVYEGGTLILDGAIDNLGTISSASTIAAADGAKLMGGGTVSVRGGMLTDSGATATLTNVNNTIIGTGRIVSSTQSGSPGFSITNEAGGTIAASGGTLSITGVSLTNDGTLHSVGGATLSIDAGSLTNYSGSALTGGTYFVDAGATMRIVNGAGGIQTLSADALLSGSGFLGVQVNGTDASLQSSLRTVSLGAHLTLDATHSTWSNALTVEGTLNLINDTFTDAAGLTIGSGGGAGGIGTFAAAIDNEGIIVANGGLLTFAQAMTGTGAVSIGDGASARFGSSAAAALTVNFDGAVDVIADTLAIDQVSGFAARIGNFQSDDQIDLTTIVATSATLSGTSDVVVKNAGGATLATLHLVGDYTGSSFHVRGDGASGTYVTVTPRPPIDGPDSMTFTVSEDAYAGDAKFVVLVDGVQVGDEQVVTALHGAGASQDITLTGDFTGASRVEVRYVNDLYGGSPSEDRNFYIEKLIFDGHVYQAQAARITGGGYPIPNGAELYASGAITFALHPDTLTFRVAEDAYQGDAQFAVYVDGRPVSGPLTVTASHAGGETQDVTVEGNFADPSKIEVRYLNDLYGGSASQDRNLYVDSLTYDGHIYGARSATITGGGHPTIDGASLYAAGSITFDTGLGGTDTLVLHVTQDAYNGDAQFIVLVDGHQVGGTQTAHAAYKSATPDTVTLHGDFASAHDVSVRFVNDAYGGSVGTDRNLYVLDASLNGHQMAGTSATYDPTVNHARGDAAALYVNGNATFHFDLHA